MALLGTYVEKVTRSRAGDDLRGVTLAGTIVHSLSTTPDLVLPVLRSVEAVDSFAAISLLGLGGNGSIATFGFYVSSARSCPTVMFDLYALIFHSIIR